MAKNLMPEVAKLLGVDLEEEFKFKGMNAVGKITENGFKYRHPKEKFWRTTSDPTDILTGVLEVEKLPWRPKANEDYFYVGWLYDGKHWRFCIEATYFDAIETRDNLNVDTGNCFRTCKEAEAAQFDVFERLTGKKWEEVHGCKAGEAE